jgi:hypothetical protein
MSRAAALARPRGVLGTDYQSFEVLVATCIALSVPVWSALLLSMTNFDSYGTAPAIAPTDEINMKVKPVIDMDSPFLKLGGGKGKKIQLPDAWKKKVVPTTKPEDKSAAAPKAQVSTKAGDSEDDITDAGLETDPDAEAIDPDAAVGDDPDAAADGSGGATGDDAPEGGGTADGSPIGTETNPLKVNAINKYRGRIHAFLYAGWRCPTTAKAECTATATVQLSGTSITSASVSGCGDGAVDGAASAHANSKVGQSIPPPPENYPDIVPPSMTIAYRCTSKP